MGRRNPPRGFFGPSPLEMFVPTVYEDMIFGPRNYGLSPAEAEARVDRVLRELNLESLKHRYNHKISGGEKRMAAIATILTMEPELIVMDEPSTVTPDSPLFPL